MRRPDRYVAVTAFEYTPGGNLRLHVHNGDPIVIERADLPLLRAAAMSDPQMPKPRRKR